LKIQWSKSLKTIKKLAYPNEEWNSGKLVAQLKKKFIGVQSVVFENKLYVLDTRSPLFGAVLPRLCL
jgi:hypothetical protein